MPVTIEILAVDDDPVAKFGQADGPEDTVLPFRLEGTDVENDALFFRFDVLPACAAATEPALKCEFDLNLDTGEGTFMPPLNFNGTLTLIFQVGDVTSDTGGTHWGTKAEFDLIINPVNDPPYIAAFTVPAKDEDSAEPFSFTIPGSDPDATDTLTYYLSENATELGMLTNPETGEVIWAPTQDLNGDFEIQVCVSDDGHMLGYEGEPGFPEHHYCRDITITINPVNDLPVAQNIEVTTDEDMAIEITLLATDIDDENLSYRIVSGPAIGQVNLVGSKAIYTPDLTTNGEDSFTYVAADLEGESNIATVSIKINSVDNAPVLDDVDLSLLVGNETKSMTVQFIASDIDTPKEQLVFSLGSDKQPGMVIDPNSGLFSWIPPESGEVTITICVTDGTSTTCRPYTLSVVGRPVALSQTVTAHTSLQMSIQLEGIDYIGKGLTFQHSSIQAPLKGRIVNWDANSGIVLYEPAVDYFFKSPPFAYKDSFEFTVTDSQGNISFPATVLIIKQLQVYLPIINR